MISIFAAIVSGTIVFVLGQIVLKLFIEPWQHQRECVSTISHLLYLHRDVYSNPAVSAGKNKYYVADETRKLAADLLANHEKIPFYSVFANLSLIPKTETI